METSNIPFGTFFTKYFKYKDLIRTLDKLWTTLIAQYTHNVVENKNDLIPQTSSGAHTEYIQYFSTPCPSIICMKNGFVIGDVTKISGGWYNTYSAPNIISADGITVIPRYAIYSDSPILLENIEYLRDNINYSGYNYDTKDLMDKIYVIPQTKENLEGIFTTLCNSVASIKPYTDKDYYCYEGIPKTHQIEEIDAVFTEEGNLFFGDDFTFGQDTYITDTYYNNNITPYYIIAAPYTTGRMAFSYLELIKKFLPPGINFEFQLEIKETCNVTMSDTTTFFPILYEIGYLSIKNRKLDIPLFGDDIVFGDGLEFGEDLEVYGESKFFWSKK